MEEEVDKIDLEKLQKYLTHGVELKRGSNVELRSLEELAKEYYLIYENELMERNLGLEDLLNQNPRFIYFLKVQYLTTRAISVKV